MEHLNWNDTSSQAPSMDNMSIASSLDLLPLLPTLEPRSSDLLSTETRPPVAPRTAPSGKKRKQQETIVGGHNHNHNGHLNHHNESTNNPQMSFALEFERAKTKVLAHEVQKLRQSVVAQQEALTQQHRSSPPPRAAQGAPPHFSPPPSSQQHQEHHQQHHQQHHSQHLHQNQQSPSRDHNGNPIKLTPESQARTRLIADARVISKRHEVHMQERITGQSQRIFDWRDPEFIRRKVMLETNLALVKERTAGRKRARRTKNKNNNSNNPDISSVYSRNIQKMMREQKWSAAGGESRSSIPEYDVTKDPHSVGWTRTRTFKQSPYAKMVQDSNSLLPSSFSDLPRQKQHEELAMQVQAQIAAERVSAATEAVAECEARQARQHRTDGQNNLTQGMNGMNGIRPSTPAQQIEAEIELFRTIILREGLLGMAASLAAEVVAGDISKLGRARTEMAEEHSFLSRLETKLPNTPIGFLQSGTINTPSSPLTLLSVLDQLRCTTVRTVEALSNWQKRRLEVEAREAVRSGTSSLNTRGNSILNPNEELKHSNQHSDSTNPNQLLLGPERIPFIWDGVNYLLKIATDVDFLDSVRPLRRTLGYPLIRNPFITPFSLDQLPPDPGPPAPLLPLTANASSKELKVAGGGRAVDSVRIFRASVAILEEESAFMFGNNNNGSEERIGTNGALMPDWSSSRNPSNPSARDTRNVLRQGLGIDVGGNEIDSQQQQHRHGGGGGGGGGNERRFKRQRAGGRSSNNTATTAGSTNTAASKLHPQDYAAVKRKTGITRSDVTALVVYSVPPAGVKLALEALRTLLHPQCDQRSGAKKKKSSLPTPPLPRAMDLEWSSLRRLAMDRENLLRCMLQYPEAVPLSTSEKKRAMMAYLNDPTFDPDVVVRQSESASKVVQWVRRVILSSLRAEKEYGPPQPMSQLNQQNPSSSHQHSPKTDRTSSNAMNTWGDDGDAADDEGGDDEEDGNMRKFKHMLQSELSQLKSSLRSRGVLSDDENDDNNEKNDRNEREERRISYSRRRRLRSRGGTAQQKQGQRTLLRTSRRIPCEDVNNDDNGDDNDVNINTVYAVLTCSMRYNDGWLVVTAHEPGGVTKSIVQLHPTYVAMLLNGTSLRDLSDLPQGDQRDRRMEHVLDHLIASHEITTSSSSTASTTTTTTSSLTTMSSRPAQLLLRFGFARSLLTGVRRIPMSMNHTHNLNTTANNTNNPNNANNSTAAMNNTILYSAYVALRVEFIDGSDIPRRVPWSSATPNGNVTKEDALCHDGGIVIFGWVHHHNCTVVQERWISEGTNSRDERSTPLVLVITKNELNLLFSHKDHLLKQGDVRAQKELARVLVDHLMLRVSLDSREREEGTPILRLDIERGIPMATTQPNSGGSGIINIPHMPIPSDGNRKFTKIKLTGKVEPNGQAIIFGLQNMEVVADNGTNSTNSTSNGGKGYLRLTVAEMAALAAVKATQAIRLAPALGRILDRIYYNEKQKKYNIDRSLVTMQCRISDEMLNVDAEITSHGLSFKVTRMNERGMFTNCNYVILFVMFFFRYIVIFCSV